MLRRAGATRRYWEQHVGLRCRRALQCICKYLFCTGHTSKALSPQNTRKLQQQVSSGRETEKALQVLRCPVLLGTATEQELSLQAGSADKVCQASSSC